MQTLIIPDIHERLPKLWNIEETLIPQAERVVMLGDFFDAWRDHHVADTATWIAEHLSNPSWTFLWGNHDCHYAFKHPYFKCSGYSAATQLIVDSILTQQHWRVFKPYTRVGKFLVSHAGFNSQTIGMMKPSVAEHALELAFNGGFHKLWMPGAPVGGTGTGGVTWLRWEEEFEALSMPQIVGHTGANGVRTKVHGPRGAISYCLDTHLHHVMWTDGKDVEIVRL